MSIFNVDFGTSAAEDELIRNPSIFDRAFFDPHDHIDKLINGYSFVVSGRKGDGKSAYYAKMKRISKNDNYIETIGINLERLNSKFFEKFTDNDLTGGKRYVPMWKCIILLELVKYIEIRGFNIQRENYVALVEALDKMGLLHGDSLETTITKLDTSNISISVSNWFSYGRSKEKEVIIRGANDIYSTLAKELENVYMDTIKFRMVFDGLDDVLRNTEFKKDIITGLIRAANEVNSYFYSKAFDFKAIILIRSDILEICRDPDILKIKLASLINLSWKIDLGTDLYQSDLANLIVKRFEMVDSRFNDFKSIWSNYFPEFIDDKDSLSYMIENTLYKPRDMLMFFNMVKKVMGRIEHKLSEAEFQSALRKYSEDYFLGHMQDELTGFIPDDAINELRTVFTKIGTSRFSFTIFDQEIKQHHEFNGVMAEDVLRLLFERGYIGQFRKRPDHPTKDEFFFTTYITPSATYQKNDDCQIHRGLIRALGVY